MQIKNVSPQGATYDVMIVGELVNGFPPVGTLVPGESGDFDVDMAKEAVRLQLLVDQGEIEAEGFVPA